MNETIDKIAEKLSAGAEVVRPLAETVIQEYVITHWIYLSVCLLVGASLLAFSIWVWRRCSKDPHEDGTGLALSILVGIGGTLTLCIGISVNLSCALAPHYHVLKDLLSN